LELIEASARSQIPSSGNLHQTNERIVAEAISSAQADGCLEKVSNEGISGGFQRVGKLRL
jgi:hypothetical protein